MPLLSWIWSHLRNNVRHLIKRYYEVNETDDSLTVRLYVPGLREEDVKIRVDHNELAFTVNTIDGNGDGVNFSATYDLTGKHYDIHQTKVHVNGDHEVSIVVPKINEGEDSCHYVVIDVNVE